MPSGLESQVSESSAKSSQLNSEFLNQPTSLDTISKQALLPHKNPALAECHGKLLPDLDQSLWDMFLCTATQYSTAEAIISLWQPAHHLDNLVGRNTSKESKSDAEVGNLGQQEGHFRWTYEELVKATELVAGLLQSQGCVEGQALVSNSIQCGLPKDPCS